MTMVDEVARVLEQAPGRSAREVRDALRAGGRVSVTVADVARLLDRFPARFRADDTDRARWWPVERRAAGRGGVEPRREPCTPTGWSGSPAPYRWQVEALAAWRRQGGRGVIEAVTGTGKTMLGVATARVELSGGGQVCVLVPTTELLRQWRGVLAEHLPGHTSVGLLGGGHHDSLGHHDVLVAVVNSAREADLAPRRPGGLLVADECHRYGSEGNRLALEARFARRLGLSATYARADDGHLAWLDPYFGTTCFRMGYRRAIDDGVTARFTVALVGVELAAAERGAYDELSEAMASARARLLASGLVPAEPIGACLEAISRLARAGDGELAATARLYLWAMQERRRLLAETPAKTDALRGLAPALARADRVIVFTQSIAAAERAAATLAAEGLRAATVHSGLDPRSRRSALDRFGAGELDVLAAPQVLDEGVDVPAADVAVILAASLSRRQMVQRMGRVLRRKPDGRLARFVIVSVEGTVEDPARGAHGCFLDEVTAVADSVHTFAPGTPGAQVCAFVDRIRT